MIKVRNQRFSEFAKVELMDPLPVMLRECFLITKQKHTIQNSVFQKTVKSLQKFKITLFGRKTFVIRQSKNLIRQKRGFLFRMNKFKKYADMPDQDWADLLMLWFKENPEMMVDDQGKELCRWAKKNCSDWHFSEPDVEVEAFRRKQEEYDSFREKVMASIYSEKMALPEWLMEINELVVHMNYTSDVEKKMVAIKNFEHRMYQEFLKYKKDPDSFRFR